MRRWLNRIGIALWIIIGLVVVGASVAVLVLTQTEWGRRQVLSFGLSQLSSRVHGHISIGALHGNLLLGMTLDDVVVTDSAGHLLARADTVALDYSLLALLRKHIVITRLRLVNPVVMLNRPPGEKWNFERIFPTKPRKPGQKPGFGSWILVENVTVRNGTLVVRDAWSPPDTLKGAARRAAIAHALSPASRLWVMAVPHGYQTFSEFGSINGFMPYLRIADYDHPDRIFDIGPLSMYAVPLRPPGLVVRSVSVHAVMTPDSLVFDSLRLTTPGSRIRGLGAYALNGSGARVQAVLDPIDFADARILMPTLPPGGGHLKLAFTSRKGRMHIVATNMDLHSEGAAVAGRLDVQVGPGFFRLGPSNVAFANVDTRLIRRFVPSIPLKVRGKLTGELRAQGVPASMQVAGWIDFRERDGLTSHLRIDGRLGSVAGAFIARDLRLRLEPLYLSLVRGYSPSVPYRGRITGTITLTGSSRTGFDLRADLVDHDPVAGRSHILADGRITPRHGVTMRNLRLRLEPLQVALLKPFVPKLPYGGTITGTATLSGSTRGWIELAADLVHESAATGRSHLVAHGGLRITGGLAARDLRLRLEPLQLALVKPLLPKLPYGGTLSGTATLTGSAAGLNLVADFTYFDPAFGRSRLAAAGWVAFKAGFSARDLRLRLEPVQVALLRPFVKKLPYDGTITGTATLTGSTRSSFAIVADLVHHDRATGRSHVTANGRVRVAGGLAAQGLHLAFEPLQVALFRPFVPKLTYGGVITGTTTLTGSPAAGFELVANLTHVAPEIGRSHITANGYLRFTGGFAARGLHLTFQPLQVALLRPFVPRLPYAGVLTGTTTLTGSPAAGFELAANLTHVAPEIGRSHITADGYLRFTGGFAARGLRLTFQPLQVALLRPFVPRLPYAGVLTGTTTLTGSLAAGFELAADLTHVAPEIGRSHVIADGYVRFTGGFVTRGLRLRLEPLQLAAVKPFLPTLPIAGTLTGRTNLTLSMPAKEVAAILDLAHQGPTGYTHLVGNADAAWSPPGFFDVNVRAPALSLTTVGAFVPYAGLHGQASGSVLARGNLAELNADVYLTLADGGGSIHTRGCFDLAAARKRYDFSASLAAFDAGAATTHAPQTSLTGTVLARGAGTALATATAFISIDLIDSRAAMIPRLDTTVVVARIAGGLVTFDRAHVRLGSAAADVTGSFGLVAERSGTLHYYVRVDTLSHFAAHLPVGTGVVHPRPIFKARRMALARADSARIAAATEVQRAAVGYPPPPPLRPDTFPLPRDTLDGQFSSRGTIAGNIERFDAQGEAQARHLTLGANYVGVGAATFTMTGFGTPVPRLHLDAYGDTVEVEGFAFDSVRARVDYSGLTATGNGRADVALFQDTWREYRIRSAFDLAPSRKLLTLQRVYLRFDTTYWTSPHPSSVSWANGLTVNDFQLTSNDGGHLRVNGRLPLSAPGNLLVDLTGLQIADMVALLQDTTRVTGLISLHAVVRGTERSPVITGTAALTQATYDEHPVPDVRAALAYADARFTAHAQVLYGARLLAVADASLPVNLALSGVTGPRVNRAAPILVDVRSYALQLQTLPSFTTAVTDLRGQVRAVVTVRGTLAHPITTGMVGIQQGGMRVPSAGVLFTDLAGYLRLSGDTVYVDSLVARSGGPIRVTGTIGLATLTRPTFNLTVTAKNATVLHNKLGNIRTDAHLSVRGPYIGLAVNGTVNVLGGVIYLPETPSYHPTNLENPTLAAAVAQDTAGIPGLVLPRPNPLLENLKLNVALRVQPDTWVRSSAADIEIYTSPDIGPLRIHMNRARQVLTVTGTISTNRGEYTYAGRVFRLSTGSATFLGGPRINPLLQVSARYEVLLQGLETLVIQIHVDGTLLHPRVQLASNAQPPLPESDLLAYLAFGAPASSFLSLQASPLAGVGQGGLTGLPALAEQQVASLALGAVTDQLVAQIQTQGTRAGLDVFRIHPGELPPEAAFQGVFQNFFTGTEFEAGKYLTPDLFAEVRGRPSAFPGLSLQYRTVHGLTWTMTWEPRYLPIVPSFSIVTATQVRVFGTVILWSGRF